MRLFSRKQSVDRVALTGAATLYKAGDSRTNEVKRLRQTWQKKAFEYEDLVGELSYGSSYFSNSFSRIKLVAAEIPDDPDAKEPVPTENAVAKAILADFGADGESAMMGRIGHHMFLVGETWVVGETLLDQSNKYTCYSISELIANGNWFERLIGPGERQLVPTDANVVRLWRPHPEYAWLATSRVKAVLSRLEELILLSDGVMSGARARLSNGILGVAQEISFQEEGGPEPNPSDGDPFTSELMEHMTTPIKDKRSAAGFIPYIMRVPHKFLADDSWMKKVDIARPLDEKDMERRRECIERIAHGLELPAEIITGMGDANHWSGWQISDDAFRAHVEPVLLVSLSGLTSGWYRQMLEAAGVRDVEKHLIWHDPSGLIAEERKPYSDTAITNLTGRPVVSVNEGRELIGLERRAEPEYDEIAEAPVRIVQTEGPVNPEDIEQGPPATDPPPNVQAAATPVVAKSIRRLGRKLADLDRDLLLTLSVGADAALRRGLEKAGARIRSKVRQQSPGVFETLKPVPNFMVAAHLGPQVVRTFGLDEDQLLQDALTDFITKANAQIRRSQIEAIRIAAQSAGLDPEDIVDRLAERLDLQRAQAISLLEQNLDEAGKAALYKPRPDVPGKGEFDDLLAPRGALRQVISLAGGQDQGPDGLGNGATVRQVLGEDGIVTEGYIWDYGSSPRQTFPGHLALDGEQFSSLSDPGLTVDAEDSWLGTSFYLPGDHLGCQCSLEQIFIQVERAA